MKKILFLALSIYVVSCTSKTDPSDLQAVDKNIKTYIDKVANDPSSYQPIKTSFVDTIFANKQYESNLYDAKYDLIQDSSAYNIAEILKNSTDKERAKYKIEKDLKEIEFYTLKLDSINKSANKKPILGYIYSHECRLKNKLGALNLNKYRIITNDSLRVISLN